MRTELTADAAVVGAGPAGAATALLLAAFCRTLLVDRVEADGGTPAARIGESLPAAARRLFRDMGLWEDFQAESHAARHGALSVWGGPEPTFTSSIRDPDGPGWLLDRARFDAWLRRRAGDRGAAILAPATPAELTRTDRGWRLGLIRHGRPLEVVARFVVEAGGRAAPLARALGRRRHRADRLACCWLHGEAAADGIVFTAAEPEGWWYTAPLPAGRRTLAFHTDSDLPVAKALVGSAALLPRAHRLANLGALLTAVDFKPVGLMGYCAAHSCRTTPAAGDGWLAVGDAALACDPLSSQGLFNALYSGMMAARAIRRTLAGDALALPEYRQSLEQVADAYRANLSAWYAMERRWPDHPFWARRRELKGVALRPSAATGDLALTGLRP
jgi:flavin-dependent dehydrogenase